MLSSPTTKICAIIVTYHPNEYFVKNFYRVIAQVDCVIIIDNGSKLLSAKMLKNLSTKVNTHIIFNNENMGIAYALNQGMALAITEQYEWCLLLDQDSVVNSNIVLTLQKIYNVIADKDFIGIISANFESPTKSNPENERENDSGFIKKKICITSGSLLSAQAYKEIGRFRDDFFIDLVDTEYCLRLRANGYEIYATISPLMVHEIGKPTRHTLFGLNINASNHPPLRRYYMARNFIILAKLYAYTEPSQIITQAKILIIDFIFILFFENLKKYKISAIIRGIKDGLFTNPPKNAS